MSMYFNSQPHEEADHRIPCKMRKSQYFNSQPHEEADSLPERNLSPRIHFNSQPHEEADQKAADAEKEFNAFQLTASRRG